MSNVFLWLYKGSVLTTGGAWLAKVPRREATATGAVLNSVERHQRLAHSKGPGLLKTAS